MTSWWWLGSGGGSLPPLPSRAERMAVRAGFCSHNVTLAGYGTIPLFDIFIAGLDAVGRQVVYGTKRALGLKNIVYGIRYDYVSGSYTYPILGGDLSENVPAFKALLVEGIQAGFTPIVTMTRGGQEDWEFWFGNNAARYRSVVAQLRAGLDLADYVIPALLWELIGPGGDWTTDQLRTAHLVQRECWGERAVCAVEYGQGYAKNFVSGVDNGQADWDTDAGMAVDLFFYEARHAVLDPANDDRNLDCTSRLLGPAAQNIPSQNQGVWYLAHPTQRGMRAAVAFETCAYPFIHDGIGQDEIARINARMAFWGWSLFGNLGA